MHTNALFLHLLKKQNVHHFLEESPVMKIDVIIPFPSRKLQFQHLLNGAVFYGVASLRT